MLFHVQWEFRDNSEDDLKRSLAVFSSWQPAEGTEFQAFYGLADGSGGVAIIDADDHASLGRNMAPFAPWIRFTASPIVPIEESAGIAAEAIAFRDSIS